VPAWIGWAAVVWILACPAVLPIVSPGDPYYPILYAIPLLMISIPLIQPGRKQFIQSASKSLLNSDRNCL
jgi:hypothetical protein